MKVNIDVVNAAKTPHYFLSVTKWRHSAIVNTTGNDDCHIILRGGKKLNYSESDIQAVKESLQKSGLSAQIMIDFSHANYGKQYKKQLEIAENVANQIQQGEKAIVGIMVMFESHLLEGQQDISEGKPLTYGQSVTDVCLGW